MYVCICISVMMLMSGLQIRCRGNMCGRVSLAERCCGVGALRHNQISSDLVRCRKSCATTSLKCTCVSYLCHDVDEWIAATKDQVCD